MTQLLKSSAIVVLIVSSLTCCKNSNKENSERAMPKTQQWIKLLNNTDLSDWIIKIKGHPSGKNYKNTFVLENNILKVNYVAYDSFNNTFGHIFYKKPFSNYKFRMDYRFTGEQLPDGAAWAKRNSGIMIHSEDPHKMGLEQHFPVSIEVQLLGGNGTNERTTANLCTPGTNVVMNDSLITAHCTSSSSKTFHGEQWVNIEIEVRNDSIIKHFINGEEVMRYSKPQYGGGNIDFNLDYWKSKSGSPLKSGYIALQSESHPVEFKNIEIMEL